MDSDKAAVWVTNWDTERNGSSHKGDDTAAKSADSAASAKSGDAKSGKATSDAIRRAATLAAILLPVIVGVTFMAIARRNGKAQSDNSGPNND